MQYQRCIVPLALVLAAACAPDSHEGPSAVQVESRAQAFRADKSHWSEPVNLGPTINTTALELQATLSPDDLSLYFASDRPFGFGGIDIWVSRRACVTCLWDTPANLGPHINTAANDNGPELSIDGHLLFFFSNRPGGEGGLDLYMSRRTDTKDDFAWGPAVNLGPEVNTPGGEAGPEYLALVENGTANLYFNRAPPGGTPDIYRVRVTRDGEIRGTPELVTELNHPVASDQAVTVRTDGRELLFGSDRPGTLGFGDLWVSTRQSPHHPWSTPVHLGAPLSSAGNDQHPDLSRDGRTLLFTSSRPGGIGVGNFDIWMSTRTPSGH